IQQNASARGGNDRQNADDQPQQDGNSERHLISSRYWKPARTRTRASKPAMIGSGIAAIIRQITKSAPKNGNSQTSARVYPISVQLTMKATTAPASAPMIKKAPATG